MMSWEAIGALGTVSAVVVALFTAPVVRAWDDKRQRDSERRAVQRLAIVELQDA